MLNDGRKRVVIDYVGPQVDCGRFPIKRAIGETVRVIAHAFVDGHDRIEVELLYRRSEQDEWRARPMTYDINDEWVGSFEDFQHLLRRAADRREPAQEV
jgi:starch synthase (maltosyl-transferring)